MKLIPAIDLKDNKCVRLKKGISETSIIYNENPIKQAQFFEGEGCDRIHLIDLNAAFGSPGVNTETIIKIKNAVSVPIQLGGGIRSEKDISFWLNNKIDFLIVGSLAFKNIDLIKKLSKKNKNKIYVALDLLQEKIMIKGWSEEANHNIKEIFNTYNKSDIKGFVVTDVSRDGMMEGLDIDFIERNLTYAKKSTIVGGGLTNYSDLVNLKQLGNKYLEGIIAGKSFYTGAIEIKKGINILK